MEIKGYMKKNSLMILISLQDKVEKAFHTIGHILKSILEITKKKIRSMKYFRYLQVMHY